MFVWPRYLRPGDLFVDVGANIGAYTVLALDCGAQVIAIEPDDRARSRLIENVGFNGYTCDVVPTAVGAEVGEFPFTIGLDSYNHLVGDRVIHSERGVQTRTVLVSTLDDILGNRIAAGVKVDVEGFELEVLRGAERALEQKRIKILQVEWNYRAAEVTGGTRKALEELLGAHGYALHRPDEHGQLHPVASPDEGRDVFAVPNH